MVRDLTRGNILKNLLLLAVPTMVGFSAQMVYDIVDIFWLGKISGGAIAGVTIFSTIFWVVESLNEIIGTSSISLISQAFGKRDMDRASLAIEQTIAFKFIVALLAALFLVLFLKPIMLMFGSGEIVGYGLEYGYIRLFFLPVMFSSYSVNTALRCLGDAKTPMYIMIGSSVLNIILDPILMFGTIPGIGLPGAGLGIFGAALSTIISQTIAFLIGFYILFSGRRGVKPSLKGLTRLNGEMDRKLMTIGLPNGIEIFIRNFSMAAILKYVSLFGSAALAAYGIGNRLIGIAFMPLIGLSMGGSAIVGQCLGKDDISRAKKTCVTSAFLGGSIMLFFTGSVLLFSRKLLSVFSDDAAVLSLGSEFLKFGSLAMVFIGIAFGLASGFSGSGYNIPLLYSSIAGRWLIQIPFLLITVSMMGLPIIWVWFSFIAGDAGELAVILYYYRSGKWLKKRV